RRDPRWRLLYCGVDLSPFREPVDKAALRAALGLPADTFVIGHVGRFHPQKNHAFLVNVATGVLAREPRARLVLVGEGALRPEIERRILAAGFKERVIFTGVRGDVPHLMKGAMDVLLLPSLYEGLPLALIESQAAGLPCVLSDTVSDEADVAPELIRRLSLDAPVERWVDAVLEAGNAPDGARRTAVAALEASPFNILESVAQLERIYEPGNRGD
ncbi:MAG: glycosyltransferase, partial [Planctomycetota bacterium]